MNSVHAFAQSPIGKYFVGFLAIGIAITVYFILDRLDYLKSEAPLESVVSRESSFLFNNLVLLASCFAVLWGTLFPVISEAVTGEKISVDAPFFNRVNIPIGLFLMFLTGVGPLIAWRRSSFESLKRAFLWPTLGGVVLMIGLAAAGMWQQPYALVSFGLCLFVATTIFIEFWKGASAIKGKTGMGMLPAMVELTHRNTRRYGGYIVHLAIVFMFIGFTGQAFNQNKTVEVAKGDTVKIGHYDLTVVNQQEGENENYVWNRLTLDVNKNGSNLGTHGSGETVLQSEPSADFGGGHPAPLERRFVHQLRRAVERQPARGGSVLCVSAGLVDLDRLVDSVRRHDHLSDSEQSAAAICPHASGRNCEKECSGYQI